MKMFSLFIITLLCLVSGSNSQTCEVSQYLDVNQCVNYTSQVQKVSGELGSDAMIDTGNTAWMLMASSMVMLMTPGLAFFYGGLSGQKAAINTMMMCIVSIAVVTVQWVLVGYSFAFYPNNSWFGNFGWAALRGVGVDPSGVYGVQIPHILYATFQNMFAQITPAIISGAIVGRMKFSSYIIYIFLWSLLIYNPLAHWVWGLTLDDNWITVPLGWIGKLPAIDFAGGTVIHISSGFSGLAAALILGKRLERDNTHNLNMVVVGTAILYFSWFGFNAGSAGAANGIAAIAFFNTHLTACVGMLTWMVIESIFEKKQSVVGAASGIVAGLVAITPACGYVTPMASFAFGIVASIASYGAIKVKEYLEFDDTLDCFALHGVSGIVGSLMTGMFATQTINPGVPNGAFYGNPMQLVWQIIDVVVAAVFSMIGTTVILFALKYTIGIRVEEKDEIIGIDSLHGATNFKPVEPVPLQEV